MKLGMLKYHFLLFFRDPLLLVFGFALPFVQLFLSSGLVALGIDYYYHHFIDIEMPFVVTLAVMAICMTDAAYNHAHSRQIKFLRRLRMTPVKPVTYILTGILSRLVVILVFFGTFLAVSSVMFDVNLAGRNWLVIFFVLLLIFAMFYFLGMLIANVLKDGKKSQGMLLIVFFGFLLLFYGTPVLHTLPDVVRLIIENLPSFNAMNLLRYAWMGMNLFGGHELMITIGLTVVFGILSIRFFKYD